MTALRPLYRRVSPVSSVSPVPLVPSMSSVPSVSHRAVRSNRITTHLHPPDRPVKGHGSHDRAPLATLAVPPSAVRCVGLSCRIGPSVASVRSSNPLTSSWRRKLADSVLSMAGRWPLLSQARCPVKIDRSCDPVSPQVCPGSMSCRRVSTAGWMSQM